MSRFTLHLDLLRLPLGLVCLTVASLLLTVRSAVSAGSHAWQPLPSNGLVITEFYYNPPGLDKEREWVELANLGDRSLQLEGIGLGDEEQPGEGEGMLRFPEGSEIGPGEAIVVARTAVGFRALFGASPNYEITDTDTAVPELIADHQWASGEFALANDGDEIILIDDQEEIVDALNYGDRTTYFAPGIPSVVSGQSIERIPAFCDTDSAVDWRPQSIPTPGVLTTEGQCASAPRPDSTSQLITIGEIQGSRDVSPLLNKTVTFRGLVTGTREDQNASGVIYHTMFVQDSPGREDKDPATSDAVALFLGRQRPRYEIGDQVVVTGQVTEYFGLTEINDKGLFIELEAPSQPLPLAETITMPQDERTASEYLEAREGMLVNTGGQLPVFGPTHSGCGFALGRMPNATRPIRHSGLEDFEPPILVLYQSDVDCSDLPALKTGDLVSGVAGPLTYHFEQYKVVQQNNHSLHVERVHFAPAKELSGPAADDLRVATLNLDNYLAPSLDPAESSAERLTVDDIEIKKRKLAYAISHTLDCPELIGVQEVESEALLMDLAEFTAGSCGFLYQVTHRDSVDGRGIDVALLSDPRRVNVDGVELRQACSPLATGVLDTVAQCPAGEEPLFSRPPLEAMLLVDGEPLTLFVNHFKSKRGGERETAPRRLAQARHVRGLVHERLLNEPQALLIVLGDFNDYNLSPVWRQLQDGGVLYDAMQKVSPQERYSYVFDGMAQLVDGILVSPELVHRIVSITIPHVNADFPVSLALDDSPAGIPFHASDHDPVLLTLSMTSHSIAQETVTPTRIKPQPTTRSSVQPTGVLTAVNEPSPTVQTDQKDVPPDPAASSQNVIFVGLALLSAAVAVVWLARRFSE